MTKIESALREIWCLYDSEREKVITRCKCNKFMSSAFYVCEECKRIVPIENFDVYHILPVTTLDQGVIVADVYTTLFVKADKLKGLCKECYKTLHTAAYHK